METNARVHFRRRSLGTWVAAALTAIGCRRAPQSPPRAIDAGAGGNHTLGPARTDAFPVTTPLPLVADASADTPSPSAIAPLPAGSRPLTAIACGDVGVSSVASRASPMVVSVGDLAVPWLTAPRDVVGAWFEQDVPEGVTLDAIAVELGVPPNRAFDAGPRPSIVRVSHDGHLIGEYPVDPALPGAQFVPAHGSAGRWRVEVRAVQPGTDPRVRSLYVRQMGGWGTLLPGARDGTSCAVIARVGVLPRSPGFAGGRTDGPYASLDAYCEHWRASPASIPHVDDEAAGLPFDAGEARDALSGLAPVPTPGATAVALCEHSLGAIAAPSEWPTGAIAVAARDGAPPDAEIVCTLQAAATARQCGLALHSPRGWFLAMPLFPNGTQVSPSRPLHTYTAEILGIGRGATTGRPWALQYITAENEEGCANTRGDGCEPIEWTRQLLLRCDLDGSSAVTCAPPHASILRREAVR